MSRLCHIVRVFTRGEVGGNHLGVVLESQGLGTIDMQAIATDLGFSETIFLSRGDPQTVRIFTPGREMPFAGHPLVGMTWVLHEILEAPADRLICGIGTVRIGCENGAAWIEAPPQRPVRVAVRAGEVATALGLTPPVSAAWVDMPIPYLLLELDSPNAVAEAAFASSALEATGVGELCIYAAVDDLRVKTRFFAPEAGVFEDPATGSAAVALATKLAHDGRLSGHIDVDQGDELGHPSTITLDWGPAAIRIGGTVRLDEVRSVEV